MLPIYNHNKIEPKWQDKWERDGLYHADIDETRQKYYALTMLPYPSGEMHIGHWYAMTPSDARARYMRMKGYNVMFPMGFDAFGLPAENAAIKRNIHPKEWTYANIDRMRSQLKSMGAMFDWRREAISSDPKYYHWSQLFFTQLYKNGLAYRKMSPVDWCPNCNTTLAREQVWGDDRHCERCGTQVIKKDLEQWFFRTTNYAEELLDFSQIDWPERVKTLQTNWIGRSEGASVVFHTETKDPIEVFTTRPDTLWGATFMVLAPEHPLVNKITTDTHREAVETYVQQAARQTDIERETLETDKTGVFTGGYAVNPVNNARIPIWIADYVLMTYGTGAIMAVPAHDERDFEFALKFGLPILPVIERVDGKLKSFAALESMETEFPISLAQESIPYLQTDLGYEVTIPQGKFDQYLQISQTNLRPGCWNEVVGARWFFIFKNEIIQWDALETEREILARCKSLNPSLNDMRSLMEMLWQCKFYRDTLYHHEYGMMINSDEFSGTSGDDAVSSVIAWLEERGTGTGTVNYHLRDWLISRQRYWGAPIPMVYCQTCGVQPVPDDQLPILLPDNVQWLPTGESPLKLHPTWSVTSCPLCGESAMRETDTMDTFMCSSWYHLRYLSPDFDLGPFDPREYDYWMPVDTYTGGIEHATMHLIYTRFFHKAGRDMGIMKGSEPMLQLRNQGIVLGEDSEKMSKSRGNVIAPDDLVNRYGADVVRAYLMFFSRWDLGGPWNSSGIGGVVRWLRRVWILFHEVREDPSFGKQKFDASSSQTLRNLRRRVHQTLEKVSHDYEEFEFNTIISALMELLNEIYKAREEGAVGSDEWREMEDVYLRMMAPVTPHIAEELWQLIGKPYSIHTQSWPEVDEDAAAEDTIPLIVQVNGKLRDRIQVPANISAEEAKQMAQNSDVIQSYLAGKDPRRIIYVPGRLVNIVI
jgi:leucyl-tRNA synthetase